MFLEKRFLAGQIQITANPLQKVALLLENHEIMIQKGELHLDPIVNIQPVAKVLVAALLLGSPQNN